MEPMASFGLVPVALICIFHYEKLHCGHLRKGKISLFLRPRTLTYLIIDALGIIDSVGKF